MSSDPDNYSKNYNAQHNAGKGYLPDTSGLSWGQSYEANKKYNEVKQQQHDQMVKNNQAYADGIENAAKPLYETTGTSGGSLSLRGLLVILALIAGGIWYLTDYFNSPVNYSASYTSSKFDEHSDPQAAAGFVNIAENILIYPNNKENAIGEFKYGISEDSIKWFLAKANIDQAPVKKSWSSKKMVYLKNIPAHWVKMTNGRKLVTEGWFMVLMFHNFIQVREESYRKIRAANF